MPRTRRAAGGALGRGAPGRRLLDARRARPLSRPRSTILLLAALLGAGCARGVPAAPALRVGTSGDYPPFSVARDGDFEGLDVDVARRFARDLGMRLELVRFRWPDLLADLDAARFDLAMGGVTMRPERALHGTFTRAVVTTGTVVLTPRAALNLDQPGLRLGVNAGGHLEQVALRLWPEATLVRTPDNARLPALLREGAADALVTDDVEAEVLARELPGVTRRGPFTRDRKAYLGRDPVLVARLDAWLRAHEADGFLAALRARWLGSARADRRTAFGSDVDALMGLVDLRLAFMPAVAAAKDRTGRPVEDPAQEERVLAAVSEEAAADGLRPADAAALFRAQLEAARAVQRAFLALPPARRPPVPVLDLDRVARPALGRLSAAIVAGAATVAADPTDGATLLPASLADTLDPSLTPAPERLRIAGAVAALARRDTPIDTSHALPAR